MDPLGGVKKERRDTAAGHGRGDFAGDGAAFAHARDDHPAPTLPQHLHGLDEALVQTLDEVEDRLTLGGQHPFGRL